MPDVLFIDDQKFSLKAFEILLVSQYKCKIHYAVDLTEAFTKLRERDYDFIVLDLAISLGGESPDVYTPEYAGLHILDYIERERDEKIKVRSNVPIIILSVYVNDYKVVKRLELSKNKGIVGILAKSEDQIEVFQNIVTKILSKEENI